MNQWYEGIECGSRRNDVNTDVDQSTAAQRKGEAKLKDMTYKLLEYLQTNPTKTFSFKPCPYSKTRKISLLEAFRVVEGKSVNRQGHISGGRIWIR